VAKLAIIGARPLEQTDEDKVKLNARNTILINEKKLKKYEENIAAIRNENAVLRSIIQDKLFLEEVERYLEMRANMTTRVDTSMDKG
jgi:hypothetical protein